MSLVLYFVLNNLHLGARETFNLNKSIQCENPKDHLVVLALFMWEQTSACHQGKQLVPIPLHHMLSDLNLTFFTDFAGC